MYCEQTVAENFHGINYSLYVADISSRGFIDNFRNVGGAQALVASIKFQEELFKLEKSGKPLPNRASILKHPQTVRCQYANREISIHDYANRE